MTDDQVLDSIAAAKRAFKSAETKAHRKFLLAENKAYTTFGSSDVEQAARHNAIRRAEVVREIDLSKARVSLIDRLERLRATAGPWADLVPMVR